MLKYIQSVLLEEEQERQAFALCAAQAFAKNEKLAAFTYSDIEAGCWFAVRWGLNDRSVLVFKVSEDGRPVNYRDIVPSKPEEEVANV